LLDQNKSDFAPFENQQYHVPSASRLTTTFHDFQAQKTSNFFNAAQKDRITPKKQFPFQGSFFQQKSKNSSQIVANKPAKTLLDVIKAPRERSDSGEI
jgi:methionyl-tRNA formyltransferase